MDTLSPAARSQQMSRVKSKDSKPELLVRRLLHSLGYRYRLHRKDLPGRPDLVFPARKKIIFVHGCFWHRHACSLGKRVPKSNQQFWLPKLEANRLRDINIRKKLENLGWEIFVVWECEIKDADLLRERLLNFLNKQN
jgi:DNA mismatch endonuclease (patch repair protein)